MKIYYFSSKYIIKKTAQIIIILLALVLILKITQYNLFKPVMSNFDPNRLTIGNILSGF